MRPCTLNPDEEKSKCAGLAQENGFTLNPDEEKSKCAGLAQENGFAPEYVLSLLRLVNGAQKLCTC
jgi:hypothetical protein